MKTAFNFISSTITIFTLLIVVVSTQGCSGAEILSTLSFVGELSGKKTTSVETEKAVKISKKMVLNFQKAMVAVNKGQGEAFEAFGRSINAKRARQVATIFEMGIDDADTVKTLVAETKARNIIIQEIMLKKDKLTGQPRKHLAKSAEVYAGASIAGKNLLKGIKELKNASKEAALIVKKNPMLLTNFTNDMKPGMYVVSELPVLSSQWVATTVSLIAYAKINGDVIKVIKNLSGKITTTVETEKAVKISKKIMQNFQITMVAVNKGQGEAFEAFGRSINAKRARQVATIFEMGIGDAEKVKALVAETKDRDKIIQVIMLKKDKLTGQPRKHLAKSAEVYAGASVAGKNLLKEIKELKNASKEAMLVVKNNPMLLPSFTKDMKPGMYVMSELPVLSSQWVTTTVSLIAYAKINGDVIKVIKNLSAEKQP